MAAKHSGLNIGILSSLIQAGALSDSSQEDRAKQVLEAQLFNILTDREKRNFFRIWAQNWCEVATNTILCNRVANDVHAIASYRVTQTTRNMPYFKDAFKCHIESPMVNNPPCKVYG